MSVAESVPEMVEEETTEKLPPEETKSAPAKLSKDSEVKVRGKSVRISEFLKHFDPDCRRRCKDGVVKVGRPNRAAPTGVLWVAELCDCTVKGWLEANPAPVTAGSIATAAIERAGEPPAPAAPNPRAKQVTRLRERVGTLRQQLEAVEVELSGEIGPLTETLQREELILVNAQAEARDVDQQLEAMRAQIAALIGEEKVLVARAAAAEKLVAEATDRSVAARDKIEGVRRSRRRDTSPIEKEIGKVEKRIARILLHNPEAAVA